MLRTMTSLSLVFLFSIALLAQEPSMAHTDDNTTSQRKRTWLVSGESGVTSRLESDNKVTLLRGPSSYVNVSYKSILKPRIAVRLGTTGAFSHKEPYGGMFTVDTGLLYQRDIRTLFEANNEFVFTSELRFGRISGAVNYVLGDEDKQITVFAKGGYYYPLESNSPFHIHSGAVGFFGAKGIMERNNWEGETKLELITDSGSIAPGKRTLISGDLFVGLRLGRLRMGPKLGYWQKISGEFEHNNTFVYGIALSFK